MKNYHQSPVRRTILPLVILLAALGITFNWLHLHPGDLYTRIMAIGASVCHQLPTHSYIRNDLQFPICARCSGLYLGCIIAILYYAFQGRKSGLPKKEYLLLMVGLTIAWGGDGLNSLLSDMLGKPFLYTTTNTTRLVTGFGMGLVLSTALMTLFNLTIWKNPQKTPLLDNRWQLFAYIVAAAVMGSMLVLAQGFIFRALAYVSTLSILVVITALYTIFWVIVLRRENTFENILSLTIFISAGFATAMLQITLLTALRGWLIG